jgi:hypothetical protein
MQRGWSATRNSHPFAMIQHFVALWAVSEPGLAFNSMTATGCGLSLGNPLRL